MSSSALPMRGYCDRLRLCECVCVRAVKGKRLELSTPSLVEYSALRVLCFQKVNLKISIIGFKSVCSARRYSFASEEMQSTLIRPLTPKPTLTRPTRLQSYVRHAISSRGSMRGSRCRCRCRRRGMRAIYAVSYTHLTLPTILRV